MKAYLFIIAGMVFSQPIFCQAPVAADITKLNWIAGDWNRTNVKPGSSGHESWVKISATAFKGKGITMKGTDTIFVEKLQLIAKDNKIFYVAETTDNKEPVYFVMTALTNNGFECENPAHDFPKKITYSNQGTAIKATISGNGKSIDYVFEKK